MFACYQFSHRTGRRGKQIGDFYQVIIWITQVNRLYRAGRACALDRPLDNRHLARLKMLSNFRKWCLGQKAQVGGTWCWPGRFRFEFLSMLMQIALLCPKRKSFTACAERNDLHSKNVSVKPAGHLNIGNSQHKMVKAVKKEHK